VTPSSALRHWSATHPGTIREDNQDGFCCRPELGLFAVTDGVGGSAGGERASALILARLAAIPATLPAGERLAAARAALQEAHACLRAEAPPAGAGPAATIVLLILQGRHFACLWVGDSRAYLLRAGRLHPLTTDHSVVQDLIASGVLPAEQAATHPAANVITRAVGAGPHALQLAKIIGECDADDRFLLCSDGLHRVLDPAEIATALGAPGDAAASLIRRALGCAARDNVTAVVVAQHP
jgi:serine/threonine protein phosphatase Stp1